jgi:uncharacterized protein (DUF169 family)
MLALKYMPVGCMFANEKPEGATSFRKKGSGCIAPMIFSAAKGKTVAFDADSTGYPCSAFYLGYQEWIFPGIENFLSDGPMEGRECERFVKTPALAREFVASMKAEKMRKGAVIFKPLECFGEDETPEFVILFADPDQMSALVFLAHAAHPQSHDRIVTGFASACMSLFTFPHRFAEQGGMKAFWGLHDIAVRPSLPKEITSLAMPLAMYREICGDAQESFLVGENWKKLLKRIRGDSAGGETAT